MAFARYIPSHEADERHRAARPTPRGNGQVRQGSDRNVQAVLALGEVRYFLFRHRTYGVPPLSFKAGQRILDLSIRARTLAHEVSLTGQKEASQKYFQCLTALARLLWQNTRPLSAWRRRWRMLGLLKNPYLHATELEMRELTDFFLQGRTKSNVQFTEMTNPA